MMHWKLFPLLTQSGTTVVGATTIVPLGFPNAPAFPVASTAAPRMLNPTIADVTYFMLHHFSLFVLDNSIYARDTIVAARSFSSACRARLSGGRSSRAERATAAALRGPAL